jgi:hypothetical protein
VKICYFQHPKHFGCWPEPLSYTSAIIFSNMC